MAEEGLTRSEVRKMIADKWDKHMFHSVSLLYANRHDGTVGFTCNTCGEVVLMTRNDTGVLAEPQQAVLAKNIATATDSFYERQRAYRIAMGECPECGTRDGHFWPCPTVDWPPGSGAKING